MPAMDQVFNLFFTLLNRIPHGFNERPGQQFFLFMGYPLSPVYYRALSGSGIDLNLSGGVNVGNKGIIDIINRIPVDFKSFDISLIFELLIFEADDELLFHSLKLLNIIQPAA